MEGVGLNIFQSMQSCDEHKKIEKESHELTIEHIMQILNVCQSIVNFFHGFASFWGFQWVISFLYALSFTPDMI